MDTVELRDEVTNVGVLREQYYAKRTGFGNQNSYDLMAHYTHLAKKIDRIGQYDHPRDYYYIKTYDAEFDVNGEVVKARILYVYARFGISCLYVGVENAKAYRKLKSITA